MMNLLCPWAWGSLIFYCVAILVHPLHFGAGFPVGDSMLITALLFLPCGAEAYL